LASRLRGLRRLRYQLFVRAVVQPWNVAFDLRFGEILRGEVATPFSELGAEKTSNIPYLSLSLIFGDETVAADDVLVDVGCGKGRVINWWLSRRLRNRMVGLELNPAVAAHTRERLQRYRNVTITAGDGIENLPADGTLFFLFNPFGEAVVDRFKHRVLQLPRRDKIRIYYYNCVHAEAFESDPRFSLERRPLIPDNCSAMRRELLELLLDDLAVIRLKDA
jgi:SAM-dependent methyltransferase